MKLLATTLSMMAVSTFCLAGNEISVAKGKELFTSKQLGTNGKSCSSCHANGKGLVKAVLYGEDELGDIINQCIKMPLKGQGLDPASIEMKSLVMYIKSLTPASRH